MNAFEQFLRDYKESIGLLGFLISLTTLILAYRIKKQFGRNHINTKQIDHVCDVIQKLNESKIEISFSTHYKNGGTGSSGYSIHFNIFELGNYDKIQPEGQNIQYENEQILFDSKSNQLLDIKNLIDHPLTPRIIADELVNFYVPFAMHLNPNDAVLQFDEFNFVQIRTDIWEESVMLKHEPDNKNFVRANIQCLSSWIHLKESSKRLKATIDEWLVDSGIPSNNIREDFKNKIKIPRHESSVLLSNSA